MIEDLSCEDLRLKGLPLEASTSNARPACRMGRNCAAATVVVAAMFAASAALAGSVQWFSDMGQGYDQGVHQRKPIVVFFYDKTKDRYSADTWSTRLSLNAKIQAIAGTAVWCYGDVSRKIVTKNFAKALKIDSFPAISVFEPNGDMLDESARVIQLGSVGNARDQGAEQYLVSEIAKVAAKYPAKR
jgi:hypothetical protein